MDRQNYIEVNLIAMPATFHIHTLITQTMIQSTIASFEKRRKKKNNASFVPEKCWQN